MVRLIGSASEYWVTCSNDLLSQEKDDWSNVQQHLTCSNSTIEAPEKGVKYVQS